MSKVFAVRSLSHTYVTLHSTKEAVIEKVKTIMSEMEANAERMYPRNAEMRTRHLSNAMSYIGVAEIEKGLLVDSGFTMDDILRYAFANLQWNRDTNEETRTRVKKPLYTYNARTQEEVANMKAETDRFNAAIEAFSDDITSDILKCSVEEVVVGQNIQATVTKKSLKSYGKSVQVVDKRFQTTEELEKLRSELQRVNVHVPGWGTITMSPDSLSTFEVKPITHKTKTYSIIENK